jgi:aspartate/methionine/tyrosine aminotransferase
MQFRPSKMNRYCARWQAQSPITIHNSNPQPFTTEELEEIIGTEKHEQSLDYASLQGSSELRTQLSTLYENLAAENIATFAGAQEAIFCSMHSLLNKGDKVVAITPIFQSLVNTAYEIGCDIKYVSLTAGVIDWQLNLNLLEDQLKQNCKLLILNFPHNPTGAMINHATLKSIVDLCKKYDCWIFSDEVFRGLEHNPEQRLSAVADLYPKAISISVFSKAFALPGIRIGWLACQDLITIQRALEVKDYLSICNSKLDEALAIRAMPYHEKIWARSRNFILKNLQQVESFMIENQRRFRFIKPAAGCVCFPLLEDQNSDEYAEQLVKDKNLLVFPAQLFSTDLNGFRLGFGSEEKVSLLAKL